MSRTVYACQKNLKFAFALPLQEANAEEELREAFKLFDKDDNGLISPHEVNIIFKNDISFRNVNEMNRRRLRIGSQFHIENFKT